MKKYYIYTLSIMVFALILWAAAPTTIDDFFLPGSQPGESGNIEHPDKCDNCHGGYDLEVEPTFNWEGSMMAQAARDPLYLACLAIANQDAPESGDLCIRCHAPDGWLNGRSEPTDGSALNNNDKEGVQCDFCHKLVQPTQLGINPFPDDQSYTSSTYQSDQTYLGTITMIPPQSGNGMYVAHSDNAKRGPYEDAAARHKMFYSPFHSSSDICGTCHDVSNPVFTKTEDGTYAPNDFGNQSPAFGTYTMLPIERTYSEWKMSAYNSPEGVQSNVFGGNKSNVSTCQDCHMKDVSGYGCNKKGAPYRNDLPLHDMTGGNTFIPKLVSQLAPEEINDAALAAGIQRAYGMLQSAATMNLTTQNDGNNMIATVEIINETGHKLPSGYPEGRRMWINLQAYDINGNLIYESGAYNNETAVLQIEGTKIYEIKLGMSEAVASAVSTSAKTYTPGESFHFVLNDIVIKDNRIPPRGFTNANFEAIQSPPVAYSYEDGAYSDITQYTLPLETFHINAKLYYQTVSKEYIEFLRDENKTNDAGSVLYHLWETNGKSAPVVMNEVDFYNGTPPIKSIFASNGVLTRHYAKGSREYVTAEILVVDSNNNPVSGAEVFADFSGPTSKSVSGITDASGIIVFKSPTTKNPSSNWCIQITNILKDGYEFSGPSVFCEPVQPSQNSTEPISLYDSSVDDLILFRELRAYPNPATEFVNIDFYLGESQHIKIDIYDMKGAIVETVHNGDLVTGANSIKWNVNNINTGIYIVRLHHKQKSESLLIKVK